MTDISNRKKFSFDHLTPTEFEEFCFRLLKLMGFKNVKWRKGTGFDASPSDQGRDIECDRLIDDIDGKVHVEKWFVECKHYKEGVPPDKIAGALAWAEAESPDVLVVIASNFFSNQTVEHLKKYRQNRKPHFRIKEWELPDLEEYSNDKPLLLSVFGLSAGLAFLNIMHPAHLEYMKSTQLNTLDYFFVCMDELEEGKRNEIASWLYMPIIQARSREPINDKETLKDLLIDPEGYETFKQKCYAILNDGLIPDPWFTSFLVSHLLQATFGHGNTTAINSAVQRMKDSLAFMDELEKDSPDKAEAAHIKEARLRFKKHLKETPDRIREGYKIYEYFCEEVVTKLLQEEMMRSYVKHESKDLSS